MKKFTVLLPTLCITLLCNSLNAMELEKFGHKRKAADVQQTDLDLDPKRLHSSSAMDIDSDGHLSSLPNEILSAIFAYLLNWDQHTEKEICADIHTMRSVCKQFCTVIDDKLGEIKKQIKFCEVERDIQQYCTQLQAQVPPKNLFFNFINDDSSPLHSFAYKYKDHAEFLRQILTKIATYHLSGITKLSGIVNKKNSDGKTPVIYLLKRQKDETIIEPNIDAQITELLILFLQGGATFDLSSLEPVLFDLIDHVMHKTAQTVLNHLSCEQIQTIYANTYQNRLIKNPASINRFIREHHQKQCSHCSFPSLLELLKRPSTTNVGASHE